MLAHVLARERRQADRGILEDLDHDAARAEHDERAELIIIGHAEDELDAVFDHFLNEDAVDDGVGAGFHRIFENFGRRLFDFRRGSRAEENAADVRLMRNIGRLDLERDRRLDVAP